MPPRPPTSLLTLPSSIRPLLARTIYTTSTPQHPTPTHPQSQPQSQRQSSTSTSINPEEISHFSALASTWWDARGPSRLLHLMNPLRHTFISSCLASSTNSPHEGARRPEGQKYNYLDIGCGGGIFAESAARLPHTATVTAIDPSPEVLGVAKEHMRRDPGLRGKLDYRNVGVEALATTSTGTTEPQATEHQGYDIVTLFEVLEHVSDPSSFLRAVSQHVRPGGWLILSTIARTWTSWATTKVAAEDVLRIVPRGTHEWAKYVNEEEVRGWFEGEGGWVQPRCMGVLYVPGLGWREVGGVERYGNYFFGVRRRGVGEG